MIFTIIDQFFKYEKTHIVIFSILDTIWSKYYHLLTSDIFSYCMSMKINKSLDAR
jgi:hypothetical protein